MKLDTYSLEKAILSFKIAYNRYQSNTLDLEVRDGCIQRFEYTYELAVKMLKRQLEIEAAVPADIDQMSFKNRIRLGAEKGIIQNPIDWFNFRDRRNITSHTYDNEQADLIVEIFPLFLSSVDDLLCQLKSRNEN